MPARRVWAVVALLVAATPATARAGNWTRYGYDAARSNASYAATGISADDVGQMTRQQLALPGTVDSSPVYVAGARVHGTTHDVIVVTTSYGITLALDAATGRRLWQFTPAGIAGWSGSAQITNTTPLVDPARRVVYAASPDGRVHALSLATGREIRRGGWPVSVTRDATHEKLGAALNLDGALLYVTTGGYIGDAPPYQGHVVAIDTARGRIAAVFNSLCSRRRTLIVPRTCGSSDSAIWARAGAVIEPGSGRVLVATGNGPFDGSGDWGDSVLELSRRTLRLLQSYTPATQARLNRSDLDLGSTAPAILPRPGRAPLALQGGKDGKLRVLSLARLSGRGGTGRTGGELQTLPVPGGAQMFTTPAVVRLGGRTWAFVASGSGTEALRVASGSGARLRVMWRNGTAGTSPVFAGGLLYVYDPSGGLVVYRPGSGRPVARLQAGAGHWNSPIIADGRIVLPEGDANDHATSGVLDIYHLHG